MTPLLAAIAALSLATGLAPADQAPDWPQFRGPERDGLSGARLVRSWPEGGPKVLWKIPIGQGFSQVAVAGQRAYTGFSDADSEYLGAFDVTNGKELWRTLLGETFVQAEFGSGPRGTPTIAGDVVYALGGSGRLIAVKAADGAMVWEVNLIEALGAEVPRFGYAGSPLLVDDLLVLEVGGSEERCLVAFDRKDGSVRWASFGGPASYASPVVGELGGERQIVQAANATIRGVSLDGRELWTYDLEEASIASPMLAPGNRVFVSASGDTGCAMLRIRKKDGGFAVEELWKNRNMRNHFNSSVIVDGHIYGFDNATVKCLSVETGEVRWAKRGLGKGSLAVSGDRLVILSDRGKLVVAERTPEAYRELGSLQLVEGSRAWTAPSVAGGRVFVRNLVEMACIELGG